MSHSSSLKRNILRQAVAENVSTRKGELPKARRRPKAADEPQRSAWRLWLFAVPVLVLLVALPLMRRAPTAQAGPPPEPGGLTMAAPVDPRMDLRYSAPQPIDSDVFPLEVRRIVIDPGHGGDDTGTVDHDLVEKDLTLDIGQRLANLLREQGYEVLLTREDDRKLSLRERADMANEQHSDLFVSIHVNWIGHRGIRGVETYFLGTTEDPELKELARRENRESGYSLADMKLLLEGIYTGVRRDASRQFAGRVQRSLYSSLRQVNPKLENRGVKTAPFVVLVSTEMPAILAEVSCLSNREEARLLSRPLYRDHIAEALFRGIRGYADDVNQTEEKGS
ncbi:MAG: N-acetylmuramoyl-L-alanine amidase [bacterium]|nr:N-acetylmuramoyl-L-alanine amidase [bacterium]